MIRPRWRPSPNFNERAAPVDILLLHYTGMPDGDDAVAWLCSPRSEVSAHYFVGEDARVVEMVREDCRAWHAGVSFWDGATDINSRAIGIEIANPGHEHGYRPYPERQISAVIALCRDILERHGIAPHRVLAHSDVAPSRKADPGELFPWARLARSGVGLWPAAAGGAKRLSPDQFTRDLRRYGYGLAGQDENGASAKDLVTAFQRHFRPSRVDGVADDECSAILEALFAARADAG